jgi:hypothetical protein
MDLSGHADLIARIGLAAVFRMEAAAIALAVVCRPHP